MKYDAADPDWPDRDRFVLSDGHASMLLYSMLYLTGFGLELDDLREFRQWGSQTPGHPEYRHTTGVEVTTGPLGQGFANGVGIGARRDAPPRPLRRRGRATTTCSVSAATATSRRASATRRRRSPATSGSAGSSSSTTTTTSRSTAPPSSRTPTTCPKRFEAYGWHVVQLGEVAERPRRARGRAPRGDGRDRRARRWSCCAATSATRRRSTPTPPRRTASRSAPTRSPRSRRSSGCRTKTSTSPTTSSTFYREAGARGARRARGVGAAPRRVRARPSPRWPRVRRVPRRPRARRLGAEAAGVEGGRRDRHPRGVRQGRQRGHRRRARAGRRLGRPHRQHRHGRSTTPPSIATHEFGGRGVHYGIREHGMGAVDERHGRVGAACPPAARSSCSATTCARAVRLAAIIAVQGRVRVDARLGRRRRGRPDAPADRAARVAAGDARAAGDPARRRQRGRGQRGACTSTATGPTALILTRQKVPVLDGTAERAPEGVAARRVHARRRRAATASTSCSSAPAPRCRCASRRARRSRRRARRCGSCRCRRGTSSTRSPTSTARRCCRPRARRSRSRPASRFGWERYADDVVGIDRFGASAPGDVVMRELRHHPRARRRARARAARCRRDRRSLTMPSADRPADRVRAEPLVRQPHPRAR